MRARMGANAAELIAAHEAAGRRFNAAGVQSFALDQGDGPPVVLLHGVPVSSYVYRKLVPELAGQGFRAIAFDMPGLGLADRPEIFDYTWSGLSRFTEAAIDALGIDRFHLVVHDIGGPIGFEMAIRVPERVLALTALDTLVAVGHFKAPDVMRPFFLRRIGEIYLKMTPRFVFSELFYWQGVKDRSAVPRNEVYAHYDLLRRGDRGRAFLKIMRGYELRQDKEQAFRDGLAVRPYPAQVVWGEDDPAIKEDQRLAVLEFLRVDRPTMLPAKHYLMEDQAPAVAQSIASFARS
jgi:haloalkane dehalogenase